MVLLSVTVLLGGAVSGVAATSLCLHHGCPMLGSCIMMGSDGTGANGARLKLVLVDLQGKLFK